MKKKIFLFILITAVISSLLICKTCGLPNIAQKTLSYLYLLGENRNFKKLRKKSKLNKKTMPLHVAIRDKNTQQVNQLLAQKINLELKDNWGQTALFWSIRNNNSEYVELLLDNGANANTTNERGESIFYHAIINEKYDIASKLLKQGANINFLNPRGKKDTMTALHHSVWYNKLKSVKYLLKNGADKTFKNKRGYSVIDWISSSQHIKNEIKLLLTDKIISEEN